MKSGLSLLLVLLTTVIKAQVVKTDSTLAVRKAKPSVYKTQALYSYSVGIKAFGYEEFPKILNETNPETYRETYFNGLIIKLNDNQISYRISGTSFRKNIEFENECPGCETGSGRMSDNQLKIGFEKNVIYGIIQPYFGSDVGFRRNIFKGNVAASERNITPYNVKSQKNGLLLAPLLGIKLNLVEHFSLAAESSFSLLYSYEKQNRTTNDAEKSSSFQSYRKWEFLFSPVNMISLQYNFGLDY